MASRERLYELWMLYCNKVNICEGVVVVCVCLFPLVWKSGI